MKIHYACIPSHHDILLLPSRSRIDFLIHFLHNAIGLGNVQSSQSPLSMQFCTNGRTDENSFKINLKSPTTLRQTSTPSANGTGVPSTVTSTNPKTPSPSTNDVCITFYPHQPTIKKTVKLKFQNSKDFSDSIDKACAESVNDLMATIAKLDSNGVQVLPEGQRGKTTSPQVHSSTDVSAPIEGTAHSPSVRPLTPI